MPLSEHAELSGLWLDPGLSGVIRRRLLGLLGLAALALEPILTLGILLRLAVHLLLPLLEIVVGLSRHRRRLGSGRAAKVGRTSDEWFRRISIIQASAWRAILR